MHHVQAHFKLLAASAAVAALLAGAPAARAQLVNGGFDEGSPRLSGHSHCFLAAGPLACGDEPGWSGTAAVIAADSRPWHRPSAIVNWSATHGGMLAGLRNDSFLAQTLSLAGGRYTLTWLDTNRNWGLGNSYEVLLDGQALARFSTTAGSPWAAHSLQFQATAGTHTLRFQGLRSHGDGTSFIDSVALVAQPVPEPQAALMLALGLAGLALVQRQRRARG